MIWRSLRFRLIAGGLAAILVALALSGAGLVYLFERHVTRTVADDLNVVVKQVIAGVEVDAEGRVTFASPPGDPRFAEPLSGLYWQISSPDAETLRSRSLWDTELKLPQDAPLPGEVHQHEMPGPAGQRVLAVERVILLTAGREPVPVRVVVAADIARVSRAAKAFSFDLAAALTVLGLVLAIATAVQVLMGLRPLAALRRGVMEIRSGRAMHLPAAAPVEVQPLVTELNSLIDAQEREIERSRGRAADLAHGLKTPLAALIGDVERLRHNGQSQIADDVQSVAEQMRRHVDRELARARVKGVKRYAGGVRTELAPLVRSIIDTVARTTEGEKHRFEEAVPLDLSIPFERADLAEVLGNLIDNACRFARHTVRISAGPGEITVEDDGPGIAAEHLSTVLERGGRLDERGGGAGLGLSIAQDVLDAYGWELSFGQSESLGGLLVLLRPRRATSWAS